MRKLLIVSLALMPIACGLFEQEVVVVTATPPPATAIPVPTAAPTEAPTVLPTNTPQPTPTPEPTWEPVAVGDIEAALKDDGYRRFPFTNKDGTTGFDWIKDNSYEQVTTWEDGTVELSVLHDASASARANRLEGHLTVMDTVFPTGFMQALRDEHAAYNRSVSSSVTGEPDDITAYGDEWQTVWAEYNASESDIGGYVVRFSLWWWQSTCPPQYDYCYYGDFPGLEFVGDSSFVFHTILIWPPEEGGESGGNA